QALRYVVGRVLGLRVDADRPTQLRGELAGQGDDLVQGGDLVLAVVGGVLRPQVRDALGGAQRLQLGQGEVLHEPAGVLGAVDGAGGAPVGELRPAGDVGGAADLRLVPGDQHAVGGGHQVGLDEVAAVPGAQPVGG